MPAEPVAAAGPDLSASVSDDAYGLELRPVPVARARALLRGRPTDSMRSRWHPEYPQADTLDGLAMLLGAHEAGSVGSGELIALPRWWMHEIVADDVVVGDIGFHGPPAHDGPVVVEIGYNVVPAWRGRGVATRACAAVLELAWRDGAATVVAETDEDNVASQTVLRRNGFRQGPDRVWRIDRPASS